MTDKPVVEEIGTLEDRHAAGTETAADCFRLGDLYAENGWRRTAEMAYLRALLHDPDCGAEEKISALWRKPDAPQR